MYENLPVQTKMSILSRILILLAILLPEEFMYNKISGYLFRTDHHFSRNDLKSVMSAFSICKMSPENIVHS